MKKFIFSIIMLCIPLIALEGMGRIYIHVISGNELRDHYSGGKVMEIYPPSYLRLRANSSYREYFINGDGLLGDLLSDAEEGSINVVALGGSTSFYGDYMAGVKNQALATGGIDKVRFSSAGTPGYLAYQSLVNLQTRLLNLNPDILIVYHGINDLLPLRVDGVDPNDFNDYMRKQTSVTGTVVNYRDSLLDKSAFYTLLYNRLLALKRFQRERWYNADELKGMSSFEASIERLLRIAGSRNIDTILLTFAHSVEHAGKESTWGHEDVVAQGIRRHNEIIKKLGKKYNVEVVDVAQQMTGVGEYFGDYCHFSEQGIQRLVDLVTPAVLRKIETRRRQAGFSLNTSTSRSP